MSTQPAQSQQCNEVPDVPARGGCKVHLGGISPVAVFEIGKTTEVVNPSITVAVNPLKALLQPPRLAESGILHVIKGKKPKPERLHPLGAKLLDGEFADRFFGPCRSVRGAAFDGGGVADHLASLADGVESDERHDRAILAAQ